MRNREAVFLPSPMPVSKGCSYSWKNGNSSPRTETVSSAPEIGLGLSIRRTAFRDQPANVAVGLAVSHQI